MTRPRPHRSPTPATAPRPTRAVTISRRGTARLAAGHPWVYRSDVRGLDGPPRWSRLQDDRGRALGWGAVHPSSHIAVRHFHHVDADVTECDVVQRVHAAVDVRERMFGPAKATASGPGTVTGYRLVHAEADGLPGLVVDRLGCVLVVKNGCAAMEPSLDAVVATLVERIDPDHVVLRLDGRDRQREGLPPLVRIVRPRVARGVVMDASPRHAASDATYDARHDATIDARYCDGTLNWTADPCTGQKTGAYLDQRVNHHLVGARARGRGLDVFSHRGGFGLHMLMGGADEVHLVDASTAALNGALAAARDNGLPTPVVHRGDAAEHLRALALAGERFDVISVDPPAFAKRARDLPRAEAGYKDVNLHAMRLLRPGGTLASSTCSFHLSDAAFMNVLADAASDAERSFRIVERRGASPDHVERLGFPESAYLTFVLMEALD